MGCKDIDLRRLKAAVSDVLDHVTEDLGISHLSIGEDEDYYWDCSAPEVYDRSKPPVLEIGRLSDDAAFMELIRRAESGASSYNLVHIAPLLRYVGEKIKR